jgi:MoxR-like ATPase
MRGDVPAEPAETDARRAVAEAVPDPDTLRAALDAVGYLTDTGLATALYLALRLPQPLLLEGEPGVGKTEAARAVAAVLGSPLIRLQCYDGLDAAEALYEWNYPRQLLSIRLAETRGATPTEADLFTDAFLLRRPVLAALTHPGPTPAVLLIDEIDRADDDFEAFLLEVLAEASVTIPEIGTVRATVAPIVVLTSNRTRDLHDALKRRCLYHWIDYPDSDRVVEIVRRRAPGTPYALAADVAAAVRRLRTLEIQKPPGIAESIDWISALTLLGVERLDQDAVDSTLGVLVKYREDHELVRDRGLGWLVGAGDG